MLIFSTDTRYQDVIGYSSFYRAFFRHGIKIHSEIKAQHKCLRTHVYGKNSYLEIIVESVSLKLLEIPLTNCYLQARFLKGSLEDIISSNFVGLWFLLSKAAVRKCSTKKVFLKKFAKFTGKHLYRSLFFNKVAD